MTQEEVIIFSILVSFHLKRILKKKVVLQMPTSIKMLNTSCSFPTSAKGNMSNVTSHLFPFYKSSRLLSRPTHWAAMKYQCDDESKVNSSSALFTKKWHFSKVISFWEDTTIIEVENLYIGFLSPNKALSAVFQLDPPTHVSYIYTHWLKVFE